MRNSRWRFDTNFLSRLNLRHWFAVCLSFLTLAFVRPEANDLIELKEGLNLRSSAQFRTEDKNIIQTIPKDSKGIIKKVQEFSSGNFGVCVELVNIKNPRAACSWIYFNKSKPSLHLFSVSGNPAERDRLLANWKKDNSPMNDSLTPATIPVTNAVAVARRTISAIVDQDYVDIAGLPRVSPRSQNPAQPGGQAEAQAVRTIIAVNNNSSNLNLPRISCPDGSCGSPRLEPVEQCNPQNTYQQTAIESLLNNSQQSEFFRAPQREIITRACIQRNMQNFSKSSAFFKSCAPGQQQYGRAVPRACIDDSYLTATSKAFNLVAECLGDYVVGYDTRNAPPFKDGVDAKAVERSKSVLRSAKQQAALSIFSFMAQESGMHINAQSGTGAGGPGQMTGPAIETVNNELGKLRAHLDQNKSNPYCSTVLKSALQKPLAKLEAACDRKNPQNILQAMSYAFAYQGFIRRHLEDTVFERRVFGKLISTELPIEEKDRFMMEVTAWAHNTGPGGMARPLAALLTKYTREGKLLKSSQDIDQFLRELSPVVGDFNPNRRAETSNYYKKIQEQMKNISPGGRNACLAN